MPRPSTLQPNPSVPVSARRRDLPQGHLSPEVLARDGLCCPARHHLIDFIRQSGELRILSRFPVMDTILGIQESLRPVRSLSLPVFHHRISPKCRCLCVGDSVRAHIGSSAPILAIGWRPGPWRPHLSPTSQRTFNPSRHQPFGTISLRSNDTGSGRRRRSLQRPRCNSPDARSCGARSCRRFMRRFLHRSPLVMSVQPQDMRETRHQRVLWLRLPCGHW